MTMDNHLLSAGYERTVERPAIIVATAMNVILGLALAIALILKIYMLVLTDHVCTADGTTLGNIIRCTTTLEMIAAFFAATAMINAAVILLVPRIEFFSRTLGFAAAAAFISLMSAFTGGDYNWQLTLASTALFAITFSALSWRRIWNSLLSDNTGDTVSESYSKSESET